MAVNQPISGLLTDRLIHSLDFLREAQESRATTARLLA